MRKSEIVAAALALVGTPFHAQGRMPGVGLDCIGTVGCVAVAVDFEFEDETAYPMTPTGELQPALEKYLVRVDGDFDVGNVLLMAWPGMPPHHVAIYIGNNEIVHAYNKAGKVVKQSYTKFWRAKTVAAYRFPGVE